MSGRRLFVAWSASAAGRRARPLVLRLWCWPRSGGPFHADLPLPSDAGSRTVEIRLEASYAGQLGRLLPAGTLRVEAVSPLVSTPAFGPSDDLSLVVCDVRIAPDAAPAPWRPAAVFPPARLPKFGNRLATRAACPATAPAMPAEAAAAILPDEAFPLPPAGESATGSGAGSDTGGGWPWPAGAGPEAAG